MKTPQEIFQDYEEIKQHTAVRELISEYEKVCDALIEFRQNHEWNRETPLKILVREILDSIKMELDRDFGADRFKESERVDFKYATENLQRYIQDYCRDHKIYL